MPNKPFTGKMFNCAHCKSEFYVPINRFKTAKYCSRSCMALAARTEIESICAICDEPFKHIASRANKAKYCSTRCYNRSQINRGEKEFECVYCHSKFLDSPSRKRKFCSKHCVNKASITEWRASFTTVRKQLLKRGLINKCSSCGFDKNKEILGIHHKDADRSNNDLSNLEILCPNCHSMRHVKHITHVGLNASF